MRSSTGDYYIGLDHVRALAAFLVFAWHFISLAGGEKAPAPIFPLSLMTEGHTGVALFMTLSGYLFARILTGRSFSYRWFLWNRFLRLGPLLFLVILLLGVRRAQAGLPLAPYLELIARGLIEPTLPNGGWSVAVELHFYLLLPMLLAWNARWRHASLMLIGAALCARLAIHQIHGEVQTAAYWTIIGRIDQFVLGMLAQRYRAQLRSRHVVAFGVALAFAGFYRWFDELGGNYMMGGYPSPSRIWIYLPTVEGLAYATLIAWYDSSFVFADRGLSKVIARIGRYSYSIYLLHGFFVPRIGGAWTRIGLPSTDLHVNMLLIVPSFLVVAALAGLSYNFIELPFLSLRRSYIAPQPPPGSASLAAP